MPTSIVSQIRKQNNSKRTNRTQKKRNPHDIPSKPNLSETSMAYQPAYNVGAGGSDQPTLRGGPGGHGVVTSTAFRGPSPSEAVVCNTPGGLQRSTRRPSPQAAAAASERSLRRQRADVGLLRGTPAPTEEARDRAARKYSSSHGGSVSGVSSDNTRASSMETASSSGCSLVRGSPLPSESARDRARVKHDWRQWSKGLTKDLMNVGRESVGRSEAPKPQRNVTEPTKVSSSLLHPNRYAGVKPSSSSPYGDPMPPRAHSNPPTQHGIHASLLGEAHR